MSDYMAVIIASYIVITSVVISAAYATVVLGRLPRGLRWTARMWDWLYRTTLDRLLRVFYPEVWATRREQAQREQERPSVMLVYRPKNHDV